MKNYNNVTVNTKVTYLKISCVSLVSCKDEPELVPVLTMN